MKLKDAILCSGPIIPDYLKDKIQMRANCQLNKQLILYFTSGLFLVAQELEEDGYSKDDLLNVVIVFSKDGNCPLIQDDSNVMGCHFSLIVYNINKLLIANNVNLTIFTYVEELVHHFWRISNEKEAKLKTLKVLQRADPSFTIDTIKGWGVNWE